MGLNKACQRNRTRRLDVPEGGCPAPRLHERGPFATLFSHLFIIEHIVGLMWHFLVLFARFESNIADKGPVNGWQSQFAFPGS